MNYPVIAECVDARDGRRYFPGDVFPDPDEEQLKRLLAAGCLKDDPAKAAGGKPAAGEGEKGPATSGKKAAGGKPAAGEGEKAS